MIAAASPKATLAINNKYWVRDSKVTPRRNVDKATAERIRVRIQNNNTTTIGTKNNQTIGSDKAGRFRQNGAISVAIIKIAKYTVVEIAICFEIVILDNRSAAL
jgi:hypothetical protein